MTSINEDSPLPSLSFKNTRKKEKCDTSEAVYCTSCPVPSQTVGLEQDFKSGNQRQRRRTKTNVTDGHQKLYLFVCLLISPYIVAMADVLAKVNDIWCLVQRVHFILITSQ